MSIHLYWIGGKPYTWEEMEIHHPNRPLKEEAFMYADTRGDKSYYVYIRGPIPGWETRSESDMPPEFLMYIFMES